MSLFLSSNVAQGMASDETDRLPLSFGTTVKLETKRWSEQVGEGSEAEETGGQTCQAGSSRGAGCGVVPERSQEPFLLGIRFSLIFRCCSDELHESMPYIYPSHTNRTVTSTYHLFASMMVVFPA